MNISVPDDLAEQVRALKIPISETCQYALKRAVDHAVADQKVMEDIDAVIERLRETRDAEAAWKKEEGRNDGIAWAKRYALASELQIMAFAHEHIEPCGQIANPHTLVTFMSQKDGENYASIDIDPFGDPYWDGFTDGAREVWDAVADKL